MNSKLRNILLAGVAALGLASCDEIADDDRFIHMDEIVPQRAVLLVDFTGQGCSNCPSAHVILETLEEQYGDSLVAVSMHVPLGSLGVKVSRTDFSKNRIGLAYDEGMAYYEDYNTLGTLPAGSVDFQKPALDADSWSTAVRHALVNLPEAVIKLESAVDGDSVRVTAHVSAPATVEGNVTLWLLEDHIVAQQLNGNDLVKDYEHNNVFRRAFNGVGGTKVSLAPGKVVTLSYATEVVDGAKERFNRDNLKVIGFVQSDKGVIEVARAKVANGGSN